MNILKFSIYGLTCLLIMISCVDNNDSLTLPSTYSFERDGVSTVSFKGQTTRILMAEEILGSLVSGTAAEAEIDAQFAHTQDAEDFKKSDLNASDKNVRGKIAASVDFFETNTTESNEIKAEFDDWIKSQVDEVFTNWDNIASAGKAGYILETNGSKRYVNKNGIELDQVFAKALLGAMMLDQVINNYASRNKLDGGTNIEDNNNTVMAADDKKYTTMEHYWDEGFGYVYGAEQDITAPTYGVDSFLNKYIIKVDSDADYAGIADDIYNAFVKGRAAIVVQDYSERDEQAAILREKLSLIPAIRAVYYLQRAVGLDSEKKIDGFHAISEAIGLIYSLQFTRQPGTNVPYLTSIEVSTIIDKLVDGEGNGLWDVTDATLNEISQDIVDAFDGISSISEAAQ